MLSGPIPMPTAVWAPALHRVQCPKCGKLLETPMRRTCYNCGASLEEVWRRAAEPWARWRTVALITLAAITVLALAYLFLQLFRPPG